MGSSGSSNPADTTTTSVSSTSQTSPLISSSTALIDPEGGSIDTLLEYGGISKSQRSSVTSLASAEESERSSLLLENPHAKFNPNCVFESETWGQNGVAGIGDEISNLLKNIVGSGGLSIPGGIAAFANAPSAMWPSVVVIWIMGIANAYSFSLLGRICAITKSSSYSMAWERTVGRRYGSKYQLFVDSVVFGKAILGTWSFSIIIASTCTPLYRWVLENSPGFFGIAGSYDADNRSESVSPSAVLVAITLFVLFPMCLSQRLASLSIFSAIGTLGTLVTISTMILRYLDGSYAEGGIFYDDLSLNQRPSFGTDKGASAFLSFKSLTLVSIMTTGYIAHYNAPKYYYELKDHTTGRFNIVVTFGFFFAAITYTIVSTMGFLTFGENSMGFVLDNYSYRDPLATAARFGVAVSVIFAYPLLFHGGRDGLVALLRTLSTTTTIGSATNGSTSSSPTQTESNIVTVLLLSTVTALAIYVNDLTFVLSFSGATMSSLIIYIFPPLMFSALVKNCCCYVSEDTDREVRLGYAMMTIGAILGVAGAYVSVERAFF